MPEQLDSYMGKKQTSTSIWHYTQILKWIIDLNINAKSIKLLEKNIGEVCCQRSQGRFFLNLATTWQLFWSGMWSFLRWTLYYVWVVAQRPPAHSPHSCWVPLAPQLQRAQARSPAQQPRPPSAPACSPLWGSRPRASSRSAAGTVTSWRGAAGGSSTAKRTQSTSRGKCSSFRREIVQIGPSFWEMVSPTREKLKVTRIK